MVIRDRICCVFCSVQNEKRGFQAANLISVLAQLPKLQRLNIGPFSAEHLVPERTITRLTDELAK